MIRLAVVHIFRGGRKENEEDQITSLRRLRTQDAKNSLDQTSAFAIALKQLLLLQSFFTVVVLQRYGLGKYFFSFDTQASYEMKIIYPYVLYYRNIQFSETRR